MSHTLANVWNTAKNEAYFIFLLDTEKNLVKVTTCRSFYRTRKELLLIMQIVWDVKRMLEHKFSKTRFSKDHNFNYAATINMTNWTMNAIYVYSNKQEAKKANPRNFVQEPARRIKVSK